MTQCISALYSYLIWPISLLVYKFPALEAQTQEAHKKQNSTSRIFVR